MRRFASQYLITNAGPILKRAVVATDDEGRITGICNTGGELKETESVEYFNGIIIPGFVNCHCHLELSHMKGSMGKNKGLAGFIRQLQMNRPADTGKIVSAAVAADNAMYRNGVALCADICNTGNTFGLKRESRIKYINLIEIFGIDPAKAEKRIGEATVLAEESVKAGLKYAIVPHSSYSVSLPLFSRIKELTTGNEITSIHFMECAAEKEFLENHSGPLMETYRSSGFLQGDPEAAASHDEVVLNKITPSGNLILVHNTFADKQTIRNTKTRKDLFWCLCPNSNLFIEGIVPPVNLLVSEGCEIVIGTDSLASNHSLDILEELKTLQFSFPELALPELVKWATINGAKALGEEQEFGSIETGKKPGLVLIENADLQNFRFTGETEVRRLI